MPSLIVMELLKKVSDLENKVAILMSWHKVQIGLLTAVLAACVTLIIRK